MPSPRKEKWAILQALREGTAPSVVKRQASRGAVPVAADELLEILVLLTKDPDPTCSEEARKTLASWPVEKCAQLLSGPELSAATVAYFSSQEQVPDSLKNIIAAHPQAEDTALAPLAGRLSVDQIRTLAEEEARLAALPQLVAALVDRSDLPPDLRHRLEDVHLKQAQESGEPVVPSRGEGGAAQPGPEEHRERISLTQKVAQMTVSERVQLGLKGNRDERMVLVRDSSKVVYRAVLQSPKLTDSEVESFASMKNVAEEVLRIIAGTRRFRKNYSVVRNLANNPRTPLDVSLPLLNLLTGQDLKFLTRNRNIPDTLCTMAAKLHMKRTSGRGGRF